MPDRHPDLDPNPDITAFTLRKVEHDRVNGYPHDQVAGVSIKLTVPRDCLFLAITKGREQNVPPQEVLLGALQQWYDSNKPDPG